MRLEDLYPNFGKMSQAQQAEFIFSYRQSRSLDLAKPSTYRRKAAAPTRLAPLTEKEKVLMSLLGLKKKDVLALRESVREDNEDDTKLLFDDSLDLDEAEEGEGFHGD